MCRSVSFRLCLLAFVVLHVGPSSWIEGASVVEPEGDETPIFETVRTSNAALFNRLGLSPLRISPGHHKKRLAGPEPPVNYGSEDHQSYGRRHGHRDSHVYIVKLPPSPPYYAITRPHKETKNDIKDVKKAPSFPVGFQSNGKPGGIYHWNLPLMKKIAEKKRVVESRIHQQQNEKKKKQQQQQQQKAQEIQEHPNEIGKSEDSNSSLRKEESKDMRPSFLVAPISVNDFAPISVNDFAPISVNDFAPISVNDFAPISVNDFAPLNKRVRNNDKRLSYPGKGSRLEGRKGTSMIDGIGKRANGLNKNYRMDDSTLYNIKPTHDSNNRLTWHSLNDPLHDTMYGSSQRQKKHRKKSALSYYAPFSLKSGSTSLQKNFSGNGKPKAFYVIEKSRKPVYYHPLLP